MFEIFYNMSYNPFSKSIRIKDTFKTPDITQVHTRLNHIKEHGGIGLITAEPGFGKTYAIRSWTEKQNLNTTKIVYISMSTVTNREFLIQLCYGLGVEPRYRKCDIYRDIQDVIKTYVVKNVKVVIFLDEAHYLLPSILKDLQIITNFKMDSDDLVTIVLVGHSVLSQIIKRQPYESLRQRLVVNFKLKGMTSDICHEYVRELLGSVGADREIFDRAAIKCANDYCRGSIRNFNSIITNSLIIGANQRKKNIDIDIVQSAADTILL